MTPKEAPPLIGLLSDSVIGDDPRLRRQGDILASEGFRVLAVGLPGGRSPSPAWPIVPIDDSVSANPTGLGYLRKLKRLLDIPQLLLHPGHAFDVYWRLNPRFAALKEIAARQHVDFWIANDWSSLPIALEIERTTGTPFGYDTHELAIDEYAQNPRWRLALRPVVAAIEEAGIRKAAFVTCVSDGIADRLMSAYDLVQRPIVVRNTPIYQQATFRPTGSPIRVLYHGVIAPGRALEACIASVPRWRPEFTLTLRGPGDGGYLAFLRQCAASSGAGDRITFADPVPMTQLVSQALDFDVGLFVIKGHSLQNRYVLPNKFFEYTMAGLALCVSDLPEMRKLALQKRLGHLVETPTPEAIAQAINALDREMIDTFKTNALAAAGELCWDREGRTFTDLTRAALCANTST
jgi:glycosyltransferase involved in cell wall biosynthesis